MKKMSFWIAVVLLFVAAFFFVGLVAALAFLISAIFAPFIEKVMRGLMRGFPHGRFWIAELVVAAVLLFLLGATVALAWLVGAIVADVWG